MTDEQICLNCSQKLHGEFCHVCGQQKNKLDVSFSELVQDFFGDMFTYDSRFYRTMIPLLFKPGFLSHEFYVGRRIRYVPPLRLYLFISFILFLWLAMIDGNMVNVNYEGPSVSEAVNSELASEDVPAWLRNNDNKFLKNLDAIQSNPNNFLEILTSRLPHLLFLLLPLFAVFLAIHYTNSGYNYLQHLIFALHFHAFVYLLILLFSITDQLVSWEYGGLSFIIILTYLSLALRRAYSSGKVGCIFKALSLTIFYYLILAISMGLFLFINIMNYA